MTAIATHPVLGRWRIVEADMWDCDYLDLVEPASMTIGSDGRGEIAFGAMQASLDLEYSPTTVSFTGFDEMDEVSGSVRLNCSTTAPLRSSSHTTSATRPCSRQNATLLQQPARAFFGLIESFGIPKSVCF